MSASVFDLKFAKEAEEDIRKILVWYSSQSQPASNKFVESVDALFDFLSANPYSFSKQRKNFRVAYVKKFPYAVIYEIAANVVLVLRIIHTSRSPRRRFRRPRKK